MKFKDWINKQINVKSLGNIVIFYIPSKKINKEIRKKIHDFFVSKHSAYTHECGEIVGYWLDEKNLIKDKHERYEISIKKDKDISDLVNFLSRLCNEIKEKSIYLTVANESYLIFSK